LFWPQTCILPVKPTGDVMKTCILLFFSAFMISSCTFYEVEPRYDERDRIVGYYEVEEYSETYDDYTLYDMRISKSGYHREIYFHNFYAADIRVYAKLEYDRITIPFQVVDGYEVEGVGTLYGNELSLSYRVKDVYNNSRTDFCETKAWLE
jgi:hypothetical protein